MSNALDLFRAHEEMLTKAVGATRSRQYYSAFNESPSPRVYGEHAAADGKAAFEAYAGTTFPLDTPGADGTVASEKSPFGFPLDVSYPRVAPAGGDGSMAAAWNGMRAFPAAGPRGRGGGRGWVLARR